MGAKGMRGQLPYPAGQKEEKKKEQRPWALVKEGNWPNPAGYQGRLPLGTHSRGWCCLQLQVLQGCAHHVVMLL